jgi:hypothetical protein
MHRSKRRRYATLALVESLTQFIECSLCRLTCVEQGSVALKGDGGDLTMDNLNIQVGEGTHIVRWSKTAPCA